jgi:hypothetical protein
VSYFKRGSRYCNEEDVVVVLFEMKLLLLLLLVLLVLSSIELNDDELTHGIICGG